MAETQAGWYPDPSGDASKLRYWDGAQWTSNLSDAQPGQTVPQQPVVSETPPYSSQAQPVYTQATYAPNQADSNKSTLRMVAFVFCIISTVSIGWLIIPLAWLIPMTIHCWGVYKGTKSNTTAFGVLTLIFVSMVSGILLLISGEDKPNYQY